MILPIRSWWCIDGRSILDCSVLPTHQVIDCSILPTTWCANGGKAGFAARAAVGATPNDAVEMVNAGLNFKQGGSFELCWSANGVWDNAQLWGGTINVNGYYHKSLRQF